MPHAHIPGKANADGTPWLPDSEHEKMWYEFASIPGTKFKLNDPVTVTKVPFSGQKGSIISLEEISEDPVYYLELENGESVQVLESYLKPVRTNK